MCVGGLGGLDETRRYYGTDYGTEYIHTCISRTDVRTFGPPPNGNGIGFKLWWDVASAGEAGAKTKAKMRGGVERGDGGGKWAWRSSLAAVLVLIETREGKTGKHGFK